MVKNYLRLLVAVLFATNVMAQNVPSYVPKDGLVGWWPFNGNANDESGNNLNLAIIGKPILSQDRNNKINNSYYFNGTTDYMSVKIGNKTSITISGWLKRSNDNQNSYDIFFQYGSAFNFLGQFAHYQPWNNNIVVTTTNNYLKTTKVPEYNIWHHFVATYIQNGFSKFYINGNLIDSSKTICKALNTSDFSFYFGNGFGPGTSFSSHYYKGFLDDIGIWDRALSDQEIKQLYEGCTKETATLNTTNGVILKNSNPITLSATPTGGLFTGKAIFNGDFTPKNANLGSNSVDYHFINSQGCKDSTHFKLVVYDTLGNKCSTYDTILKINFKLTTGIKAGQQTSMNVYPNPASDVLIIEANDIQALGGYSYKILDLQGKEVYNALATSAKTEISLKSIGTKGMYILHIVDEKGVSIENKKIVLE